MLMSNRKCNRRTHDKEAQQVGYFDKFSCQYTLSSPSESPRNVLEDSECKAYRKLGKSFGAFYPEYAQRRIIDIINQCRYIATKKGMDKRQLIASIKKDELQGKTYLHAFQHTLLCNSQESPLCPTTKSSCVSMSSDDVEFNWETTHSPQVKADHEPLIYFDRMKPEEEKDDLHQCIYVSRPPSYRNMPLSPTVMNKKCDMFEEDSDESDFDPSETSQMLENMNYLANVNRYHIDLNEEEATDENIRSVSTSDIPPIRKPATHNLSIFYEYEEMPGSGDREEHKAPVIYKSNITTCKLQAEDAIQDEEMETKSLIVQAARAKACASYAKLKEKMKKSKKVSGQFKFNELLYKSECGIEKGDPNKG